MSPNSKQLLPYPATAGIAQSRERICDNIETIRRSHRTIRSACEQIARANKVFETIRRKVAVSRRTIEDGHEALARADKVLDRRLSERG